jgi:hypothetical protein
MSTGLHDKSAIHGGNGPDHHAQAITQHAAEG